MEIKQNTLIRSVSHRGNHKRNWKIPWSEWKLGCDIPKVRDVTKAVLRGKFMVLKAYITKEERSKVTKKTKEEKSEINNLNVYLKELEKEEQTKPKVSRGKAVMIRTAINETEKRTVEKTSFSENINKNDKLK